MKQNLIDIISDPFDGPFYGEDFCIDDDGFIQVSDMNFKLAALIMRKINMANICDRRLVKIGQTGDVILLGFDDLADAESIFDATVGPDDVLVETKKTQDGNFCLYVDGRRVSRIFKKLTVAKKYIKKLDQELNQSTEFEETVEED